METVIPISGMTCHSCEIMLERKLRKVPGVIKVNVNHKKGTAHITALDDQPPSKDDLEEAITSAGYQLGGHRTVVKRDKEEIPWSTITGSLLIIIAGYILLQTFGVISFATSGLGTATLGGIFIIGLVAGTSSCLAVTGGLLLAMAAKYNEVHTSATRWHKFKPLLLFNMGRLFAYFVLGGVIGSVGSAITLSTKVTGYLNIAIALVMLYLGLSILKIISKKTLPIRLPKKISHWIADLSESEHPIAPFMLGGLTFFLPCGFTQSTQLIALASGSFLTGALTMGAFALGTLPALLGISALSSVTRGKASKLFLRFSGTLVVVLSLFNLNSGLILSGIDVAGALKNSDSSSTATVETVGDNQVITLKVDAYGYTPDDFTVEANKPTIVRVIATRDMAGCTSSITIPAFGITANLKPGTETQLGPFTPTKSFMISCGMGMVRARVNVISKS